MTNSLYNKIFPDTIIPKPVSIWSAGVFVILYSAITSFALIYGMDLFLWVIIGGITGIGIYCISPRLWIYSVLLSSYFFYSKGGAAGDESSSQPIIFAMIYHTSLAVWMFTHVFLKKKRLIRHWIDLVFSIYLGFAALNCSIALASGVQFMVWLKGWQLFLIILYYFPVRELFQDKKSQNRLLLICSIVLITQGIWNIYQYKMALSNFKWATQLFYAGIRQGAAIFSVACVVSLAGVLYARNLLWKTVLLALHLFFFAVLIVSLARAAWVGYAFGVLLIGLFAKGKYLKNFVIGASTTITIIAIVGLLFFGRFADTAWNIVSARFSSSAGFASDPSYLSRTYENESLIKDIEEYPIGGVGLQKEHNRYDAITKMTVTNTYAHNNYLGMMQKLGIPLALLYFSVIGGIGFRSFRLARQLDDPFYIFLATSSYTGLSSMVIINFVGSIFDLREGMFLLAILFAFSFIAEQGLKKQKIQTEK